MKFKISAEEYDALPDALKGFYKKNGDAFTLQVEGLDDNSAKVKEFRDNNIKLRQQVEQMQAQMDRFKDIDPEKYQQALDAKKKLDELADKDLLKEGKLDELLAKRTEAMRQDFEKKLRQTQEQYETARKNLDRYRGDLKNMRIESAVRDTITKIGQVRQGAMEDILNRARSTWQMDDEDQIIAPDKYDSEGNPLTMEAWGKELLTKSPYLFEAAQGGGASGGSRKSQVQQQRNGSRILVNPDARTFGSNLEDIASGKIEVQLSQE